VILARQLQQEVPGFRAYKGIHRPAGSTHALWIRQTARRVYPDREPEFHPDGSWTYLYSPQSENGVFDESLPSNQGMLECIKDRVPVGVFRQTDDVSGRTAYRVMGLGFVDSFDGEHFTIRGEPINETSKPLPEGVVPPFEPFEFSSGRIVEVLRRVRERRFTSVLREVYHERCSLCGVGYRLKGRSLALEGAHIIPVGEQGVLGDVRNGVLLCSNHHALYDGYAWAFDRDFKVIVTRDRDFRVSALANHVLGWEDKMLPNLPSSPSNYPAGEAIDWRLTKFQEHQ